MNAELARVPPDKVQLDHRVGDVGWGLLLMLTGVVWLVPAGMVPPGTWLFGVAAILLGVNLVRYRPTSA